MICQATIRLPPPWTAGNLGWVLLLAMPGNVPFGQVVNKRPAMASPVRGRVKLFEEARTERVEHRDEEGRGSALANGSLDKLKTINGIGWRTSSCFFLAILIAIRRSDFSTTAKVLGFPLAEKGP